ncbi:MAG: chitobiase/beta-hexosaminidase C-terminal domain-containing protein, partial [Verrucomicrobiota bacterium]
LIDDVQIYKRVLSPAEIDYLYRNPAQLVPEPSVLNILPMSGYFTNSIFVALTTTLTGSELRYTVDGSEPTAASLLYTVPILFTNSITMKARAFVNGSAATGTATTDYLRVYALNGDGITAAWREEFFGAGYLTDPRAGADADPDNDGATNLQEFIGGTDPLNPLSGFAVGIRMAPLLSWGSVPNTLYRILRKESLNDASWTEIGQVRATGATSYFTDAQATTNRSFYAIQPVAEP